MTNRELIYIVKEQKPLVLPADETVRNACRSMWDRRAGSVLVVDGNGALAGIFTGRDAVRLLAKADSIARERSKNVDVAAMPLARAMTRDPVTVAPTNRAFDALRHMSEGNFRHVPVVDNGRLRGVVSRGDFKGMEFESYRWRQNEPESARAFRPLGDIVAKQKPVLLGSDETVTEACKAMRRRKAGSVLVVDRRQRLTGIFTGRDAVRALAKTKNAAATRLAKAMTRDPATMPPDNDAIDALRAMNDCGFRHIPVVMSGRILGVVSRSDFTGIEIDRLDEEEHLKECLW